MPHLLHRDRISGMLLSPKPIPAASRCFDTVIFPVALFVLVCGWTGRGWSQDVSIVLTGGGTQTGKLVEIRTDEIMLQVDGSAISLPLQQVARVTTGHEAKMGPQPTVWLRGDSLIRVESVELVDGDDSATLQLRRQSPLSLPLSMIRAIRFRRGSTETDATWLGLLADPPRGDRVIARRDATTIEPIDVTISAMDADGVTFSLGDNTITAGLAKLEGVQVGGATSEVPDEEAPIRVEDVFGSMWVANAVSMKFNDGSSEVATGLEMTIGEARHTIDWIQVRSLAFTSGILPLTSAEIAESGYRGIDGLGPADLVSAWMRPQVNDDAIDISGTAGITFRVPQGYQRVVGSVRRHSEVSEFAPTPISISLDDESVWNQTLQGRETLGFEIPLGNARRLSLQTEPGPAGGAGDSIQWVGVRLLK